ncbi:DciA family protein [Streptomyces sp. 5K101]|uniref:DciA family protein n=1 Tax=Streptomyces sp. 5K101 TaxID=3390037 RepID=UPI0039768423
MVTTLNESDQPARTEDLAAATLRAAKEDARRRGAAASRRRIAPTRGRWRRNSSPVLIGKALADLVERKSGWLPVSPVVVSLWEEAVPQIARHVSITHFNETTGALHARADSQAWATQMRLVASRLMSRLNQIFGPAGIGPIRSLWLRPAANSSCRCPSLNRTTSQERHRGHLLFPVPSYTRGPQGTLLKTW